MSSSPATVVVPEGHTLLTRQIDIEPSVSLSPAGLLVAELGYVGDDLDCAIAVFDQVAEAIARARGVPPIAHVASEAQRLNALFAPELATASIAGGIIYTVYFDGLTAALNDSVERELLLTQFQRFSQFPQWLVLGAPFCGDASVLEQLLATGVIVVNAVPNQAFMVNVQRSDGQWVAALSTASLNTESLTSGDRPAHGPLYRASRLRQQLLDPETSKNVADLIPMLDAREHPLLFFCTTAGGAQMQQHPQREAAYLPIFADIQSWSRAARELGYDPAQQPMAALSPRKLFDWSRKDHFDIAIGFYPDTGGVRYIVIDAATIANTASATQADVEQPPAGNWFKSMFARAAGRTR